MSKTTLDLLFVYLFQNANDNRLGLEVIIISLFPKVL